MGVPFNLFRSMLFSLGFFRRKERLFFLSYCYIRPVCVVPLQDLSQNVKQKQIYWNIHFTFVIIGGFCMHQSKQVRWHQIPETHEEGGHQDAQMRRHQNMAMPCMCSGHCAVSNTSTSGKQPLFNLHQANLSGCSIHQGQLLIQSAGGYLHSPCTALIQI